MSLLTMKGVCKTYGRGDLSAKVLHGIDLTVHQGEFVSIMGPSGSGKSTILHLLGGLDVPSSGQILFDGTALESMGDKELSRYREKHVGFVFQSFNLLAALSALENVALPLYLSGVSSGEASRRAREALDLVALSDRANHRPHQLSGGQMQRVAVARALVGRPELVLADEPTGNLDSSTGKSILGLLQRCQRELGQTIVMVTHAPAAAEYGTRLIGVRDGLIVSDEEVPQRS